MKQVFRFKPCGPWNIPRQGFSQVEVAVSALLAGLLLAGSLNIAGSAMKGQTLNNDQLRARLIASSLQAEILELPFEDPNSTPSMGPESGETTSPATRKNFDDVDDYHGWSSAPQTKQGTAISGAETLTATVTVALCDPNNLGDSGSGTPSNDVKKITVTVLRGSTVITRLVAVDTR